MWLSSKESACSAGDEGLIPGLGRSPQVENGNPLQYSCLGNPMDRGAWQTVVQGVAESKHTHTQALSVSLSLSLSHTHIHSLSLSLSLSLSHTHTHTHTRPSYTQTQTHTAGNVFFSFVRAPSGG